MEDKNIVELSDKMVIDNGLHGQYVEEVLDQCVQKLYEDYEKKPTQGSRHRNHPYRNCFALAR